MAYIPPLSASDTTTVSPQACPRSGSASVGAGLFHAAELKSLQARQSDGPSCPAPAYPTGFPAPIPGKPASECFGQMREAVLPDETRPDKERGAFCSSAETGTTFVLQGRVRPKAVLERRSLIAGLRAKVHAIERPIECLPGAEAGERLRAGWTLGIDALDVALGGERCAPGLDCHGVHEIKPQIQEKASVAAMRAAVLGFALRLAVRRIKGACDPELSVQGSAPVPMMRCGEGGSNTGHSALVVWCSSKALAREVGGLYGPGLVALGLDPSAFLLVETGRAADTLWAMEEALRSRAAVLVAGVLDDVDLTAARRLSLAAEAGQTPAMLLTHGSSPAASATASRWRIGLRSSAPSPLDPRAPGGFAVWAGLERCRAAPGLARFSSRAVEWCDETYRFRLPAAVADRADGGLPFSKDREGRERYPGTFEAGQTVRAG